MQETFPCPECGSPINIGQQFCIYCGQKINYSCPYCGAPVEPLSGRCTSCSSKLNWSMQSDDHSTADRIETQKQNMPVNSSRQAPQRKGSSHLVKIAVILIAVVVIAAGATYVIDELALTKPVNLPGNGQEESPSGVTKHVTSPVIVSFDVDSREITAVESAILKWEVTGAQNVAIDQGIGNVPLKGSKMLSPQKDTTYELTATNEVGTTSKTVSISVLENVNASKIALTIDDVKQDDFIFEIHSEPSIGNTISTYNIRFRRFGEILDNTASIHTTVKSAEEHYNNIKYNNRQEVTDVVTIGERGYVLTYMTGDPAKELYIINFQKYNVYISIGGISDYDELISLAELVESRIK